MLFRPSQFHNEHEIQIECCVYYIVEDFNGSKGASLILTIEFSIIFYFVFHNIYGIFLSQRLLTETEETLHYIMFSYSFFISSFSIPNFSIARMREASYWLIGTMNSVSISWDLSGGKNFLFQEASFLFNSFSI